MLVETSSVFEVQGSKVADHVSILGALLGGLMIARAVGPGFFLCSFAEVRGESWRGREAKNGKEEDHEGEASPLSFSQGSEDHLPNLWAKLFEKKDGPP